MGAGKSAVGALVAARAGVAHHDLDAMIEDRVKMSIRELFATRGEPAFRALETEVLEEALVAGTVVSLGGGTPIPDSNWRLIRERALSVWLNAPMEVMLARVGDVSSRPMLKWDARALFASRLSRYRQADHRVDAAPPLGDVAAEVYRLWRE